MGHFLLHRRSLRKHTKTLAGKKKERKKEKELPSQEEATATATTGAQHKPGPPVNGSSRDRNGWSACVETRSAWLGCVNAVRVLATSERWLVHHVASASIVELSYSLAGCTAADRAAMMEIALAWPSSAAVAYLCRDCVVPDSERNVHAVVEIGEMHAKKQSVQVNKK